MTNMIKDSIFHSQLKLFKMDYNHALSILCYLTLEAESCP